MKIEPREILHRGQKKWLVDLPAGAAGKRRKVYRDTETEARVAARFVLNESAEFRGELAMISLDERNFILHFRRQGLKLDAMWDACEAACTRASVTAKEATTRYLSAPRETPLSGNYKGSIKARFNKFASAFPDRSLGSITGGELQGFIRSQGLSSPDYFSNLRALFRFALLHEWVTKNPMENVARPSPETAEKDVFTPAQMRAMLRACALGWEGVEPQYALVRYLVLCGFCGLRHSEAVRLAAADLHADTFEIFVQKMKTRKRGIRERYVQPEEPALSWFRWLADKGSGLRRSKGASAKFIGLNDSNLRKHRLALVSHLEMPGWLDNGLRRSFGSYHLAARENANRTAEVMGHTNAGTTKAKYRVCRRPAIAHEWFALGPEAVL